MLRPRCHLAHAAAVADWDDVGSLGIDTTRSRAQLAALGLCFGRRLTAVHTRATRLVSAARHARGTSLTESESIEFRDISTLGSGSAQKGSGLVMVKNLSDIDRRQATGITHGHVGACIDQYPDTVRVAGHGCTDQRSAPTIRS